MRLSDVYRGRVTWRELSNYVRYLSPGSATRTALNEGIPEATGEQVLLADVFDAVTILDWHFSTANGDPKKAQPKKPKRYPRWWEQKKPQNSPQRVAKIEDARRRKKLREQAIAEGRIA